MPAITCGTRRRTRWAWRIRGAEMSDNNALKLVLAWGFVGIPLAWGVIETVINALKLFH